MTSINQGLILYRYFVQWNTKLNTYKNINRRKRKHNPKSLHILPCHEEDGKKLNVEIAITHIKHKKLEYIWCKLEAFPAFNKYHYNMIKSINIFS